MSTDQHARMRHLWWKFGVTHGASRKSSARTASLTFPCANRHSATPACGRILAAAGRFHYVAVGLLLHEGASYAISSSLAACLFEPSTDTGVSTPARLSSVSPVPVVGPSHAVRSDVYSPSAPGRSACPSADTLRQVHLK